MSKDPNQDEEVGVCTECHSMQNSQKLIKNPFFQQGGRVPCQFCSGVVIIVRRDRAKRELKNHNKKRGI